MHFPITKGGLLWLEKQIIKIKYDRIGIMVPKGGKEVIKNAAEKSQSGSINGYVVNAVNTQLVKDGFEPVTKKSEGNSQ